MVLPETPHRLADDLAHASQTPYSELNRPRPRSPLFPDDIQGAAAEHALTFKGLAVSFLKIWTVRRCYIFRIGLLEAFV